MMNSSLPPAPSAPTLEALHQFLAVLSNPALAQAHLDALERAHAANLASTAELVAERERLTNAQARETNLKERERALADQASAQATTATQLANAAAALQEREQKIAMLEAAAAARAEDLDKREKALADRLETYSFAVGAIGFTRLVKRVRNAPSINIVRTFAAPSPGKLPHFKTPSSG
jgi:hypothetical protein